MEKQGRLVWMGDVWQLLQRSWTTAGARASIKQPPVIARPWSSIRAFLERQRRETAEDSSWSSRRISLKQHKSRPNTEEGSSWSRRGVSLEQHKSLPQAAEEPPWSSIRTFPEQQRNHPGAAQEPSSNSRGTIWSSTGALLEKEGD